MSLTTEPSHQVAGLQPLLSMRVMLHVSDARTCWHTPLRTNRPSRIEHHGLDIVGYSRCGGSRDGGLLHRLLRVPIGGLIGLCMLDNRCSILRVDLSRYRALRC